MRRGGLQCIPGCDCKRHQGKPYFGPGIEAARVARWRKRHPELARERDRRSSLRFRFKITPEDYDKLIKAQKGLCPICLKMLGEKNGTRSPIDHNHITKQIRGILHRECNRAIGFLKDDPESFERAARYLRNVWQIVEKSI